MRVCDVTVDCWRECFRSSALTTSSSACVRACALACMRACVLACSRASPIDPHAGDATEKVQAQPSWQRYTSCCGPGVRKKGRIAGCQGRPRGQGSGRQGSGSGRWSGARQGPGRPGAKHCFGGRGYLFLRLWSGATTGFCVEEQWQFRRWWTQQNGFPVGRKRGACRAHGCIAASTLFSATRLTLHDAPSLDALRGRPGLEDQDIVSRPREAPGRAYDT